MELISLQGFFEKRVAEYQKAGVLKDFHFIGVEGLSILCREVKFKLVSVR